MADIKLNQNQTEEEEKKKQTYTEWAREKYNEQYDAWMPWIEDNFLKYFTKDNRTSYVARGTSSSPASATTTAIIIIIVTIISSISRPRCIPNSRYHANSKYAPLSDPPYK
ncbi:hypothetical protein NPX13_g5618 [Xylaria arbuscula]|uniref:Uncharacterized protein n=1 Tax=Xylaria arbuscula TaxID=114810 RepID=A0A9W8NE57_9PEZI|nr:hypothetical protein NPX13_g5618 [Xylaria arbuscula]